MTQPAPPQDEEKWTLRLYVAGQTPRSLTAFANLKRICEEHLQGRYQIEVIDLTVNPALASGSLSMPPKAMFSSRWQVCDSIPAIMRAAMVPNGAIRPARRGAMCCVIRPDSDHHFARKSTATMPLPSRA